MTKQEFDNLVKASIAECFNKYFYIEEINFEDFCKSLKKEMNQILEKYQSKKSLKENIISEIKNRLKKYIKNLLKSDKNIDILNKFVAYNLCFTDDVYQNINELDKLMDFFAEFDFTPSKELLLLLFNNPVVCDLLDSLNYLVDKSLLTTEIRRIYELYLMSDKNYEYDINAFNIVSCDSLKQYSKEIDMLPRISLEEERELAYLKESGDIEARNKLVESHLLFAVKYISVYANCGLEQIDLIQEANMGLIEAANRFNPDKGCRFSSYAVWWIKSYITRAIFNKSRGIRISAYQQEFKTKYNKAIEVLSMQLKRKPTTLELAHYLQVKPEKINFIEQIYKRDDALCLDEFENDRTNVLDCCAEKPDMLSNIYQKEVEEAVAHAFTCLTDRELEVLKLRYGFNGEKPMSQREIGERLGICKQRVNQLNTRALLKLQKSHLLDDFHEENGYSKQLEMNDNFHQ